MLIVKEQATFNFISFYSVLFQVGETLICKLLILFCPAMLVDIFLHDDYN